MEAQERTRGTMREIKVGDDVIITDVRNVLGNNDKTSDSVEEYMAKVVSITHGVGGDVWYVCKLAVINKTLMFPQWEVFLMDKTTKDTDKKVGYDWLDDDLHGLKMFENNINIAEKDTQEDTMHDKHYREAVVEPILVMQALFSRDEFIGYLKGNILKYRLRAGHKDGEKGMKDDLDKIHVYEEWLERAKKGERI